MAGHGYVRYLVMSLTYVFEACMGLEWNEARVPVRVDYRDMGRDSGRCVHVCQCLSNEIAKTTGD
jgi:hypothetical protein